MGATADGLTVKWSVCSSPDQEKGRMQRYDGLRSFDGRMEIFRDEREGFEPRHQSWWQGIQKERRSTGDDVKYWAV